MKLYGLVASVSVAFVTKINQEPSTVCLAERVLLNESGATIGTWLSDNSEGDTECRLKCNVDSSPSNTWRKCSCIHHIGFLQLYSEQHCHWRSTDDNKHCEKNHNKPDKENSSQKPNAGKSPRKSEEYHQKRDDRFQRLNKDSLSSVYVFDLEEQRIGERLNATLVRVRKAFTDKTQHRVGQVQLKSVSSSPIYTDPEGKKNTDIRKLQGSTDKDALARTIIKT